MTWDETSLLIAPLIFRESAKQKLKKKSRLKTRNFFLWAELLFFLGRCFELKELLDRVSGAADGAPAC